MKRGKEEEVSFLRFGHFVKGGREDEKKSGRGGKVGEDEDPNHVRTKRSPTTTRRSERTKEKELTIALL